MNRRDFMRYATSAGVGAGAALLADKMRSPDVSSLKVNKEADERILDTQQIRCAWINYAPSFMKDPNTGKMSGIFYELTERVGELTNLEIKWDVETTYATFGEDLRMRKYDLYGGGLWTNPIRAKAADFSMPAFYSGLGVYVRADDRRFDNNVGLLNAPNFRMATVDGEMSQIIQQSDFPKVSVLGLPQNTEVLMLAENIITKKADATILEKSVANLYMKSNPGTLRNLADAKPIRILENSWAYTYGSDHLEGIIRAAIKDMLFSGFVEKVLEKYESLPGSYYRVRTPIQ